MPADERMGNNTPCGQKRVHIKRPKTAVLGQIFLKSWPLAGVCDLGF